MTTSTTDHQNSEEKPNKRKKISSSNNGNSDNSIKKDRNAKRTTSKSKAKSNIVDLTDFSKLDNKELVKIAKEKKITESPKDRTDLINILYASEAEEKNVTIG